MPDCLRKTLFCAITCLMGTVALAQASDSTTIKRSWFVVPILSYQQETSWGPGLAGGVYFPSHDLRYISSISYSAIYTLRNQFTINVSPKIYIGKNNRFFLDGTFGFRHYPDTYFGRGTNYPDLKLSYTNNYIYFNVQPQYVVAQNLQVGLQLSVRYANTMVAADQQVTLDSMQTLYGSAGWGKQWQTGMGTSVTYDTRDNHFYATRGLFAKMQASIFPHTQGNTYGQFAADYRQYVTTWAEQVLAWQLYANVCCGHAPFYALPTLGGEDVLRGFRRNMFCGDLAWTAQTEYRIPLFWRLKAVGFCAVGDVYDWADMHTEKIKFAYGLGLRCRLNDARVHLRVDVAKNNFERKLQFYITATEAF